MKDTFYEFMTVMAILLVGYNLEGIKTDLHTLATREPVVQQVGACTNITFRVIPYGDYSSEFIVTNEVKMIEVGSIIEDLKQAWKLNEKMRSK